jgi:hypothetical protein
LDAFFEANPAEELTTADIAAKYHLTNERVWRSLRYAKEHKWYRTRVELHGSRAVIVWSKREAN